MTLGERRYRIGLGIGLCMVAIGGFVAAWTAGVDRHITLISSMPLWPATAVLAGQWARVRAQIAIDGPDQPEPYKPESRKALLALIFAIVVVVGIGAFVAMYTAA
ncbi:MAG: hypothetical protein NVS3B5_19850 [Sphingomicrobium sp.]